MLRLIPAVFPPHAQCPEDQDKAAVVEVEDHVVVLVICPSSQNQTMSQVQITRGLTSGKFPSICFCVSNLICTEDLNSNVACLWNLMRMYTENTSVNVGFMIFTHSEEQMLLDFLGIALSSSQTSLGIPPQQLHDILTLQLTMLMCPV